MVNVVIKFFTGLTLLCLLVACAEFKEAGRSIGQTTKNVTTDIGHGSRNTFQAIGRGTKRVVNSVTEEQEHPSE
ncbi:hypothetical protein [Methylobacter sp. S3L5C]|jgi:hypothetical protein|uniref:hypothetical protein n=1 Tax=Methylobacter sp. S3L5C TaxID=2839024 RepID=UPI001FAC415C|nr:hypothetical protein [Methylobacter sp. S3L5C]UOA10589.1 hypothetical protein KKZ03_10360 [Methylobacter sp. S3L5C]